MVKYFMLSFICVAAESNIRHNNVIGDLFSCGIDVHQGENVSLFLFLV